MSQSEVEETANFYRVISLVADVGSEAMRDVLLTIIQPRSFESIVQFHMSIVNQLKNNRVLFQEQYDLLTKPASDPKEFDISLLMIIFRNICPHVTPPLGGWTIKSPDVNDNSLGAELLRLKTIRNNIYAHIASTRMTTPDFEKTWKELKRIILQISSHGSYNKSQEIKETINKLKHRALDTSGVEAEANLKAFLIWQNQENDALTETMTRGFADIQSKSETTDAKIEVTKDIVEETKDIALETKDIALETKDIALETKETLAEIKQMLENDHNNPISKNASSLPKSDSQANIHEIHSSEQHQSSTGTHLMCYSKNHHQSERDDQESAKGPVNQCTNDGVCPVLASAQKEHTKVTEQALEHNADINLSAKKAASPPYNAVQNGNAAMLLERRADVNQCIVEGTSLLFMAAQNGNTELLKLLLKQDIDVNQCEKGCTSPLFIAVAKGHNTIAAILLDRKADVNKCTADGTSPLFMAAQNGNTEIVELLLKQNADVNQCQKDGISPLSIAVEKGHNTIVELLLKQNADVNQCQKDGLSPLAIAVEKRHNTIVELLLMHNA